MPTKKIPIKGEDGLLRFDCQWCKRLMYRYHPTIRGGPLEQKCTRSDCGKINMVWFNEAGPAPIEDIHGTTSG